MGRLKIKRVYNLNNEQRDIVLKLLKDEITFREASKILGITAQGIHAMGWAVMKQLYEEGYLLIK